MAARHRRSPAPLNPYVVLADVAINLMLIVCLLFVVSAHMRDAYFESKHEEFAALAARHASLWRAKRQLRRSGQNLEFRFGAEAWFEPNRDRLSPAGERMAADLTALISDPIFRRDPAQGHVFGEFRITVTQGPEAEPGLIYRRALAIRAALDRLLGRTNHRWPIVAAGRVQEPGDPGEPPPDEVDVVIILRNPMAES